MGKKQISFGNKSLPKDKLQQIDTWVNQGNITQSPQLTGEKCVKITLAVPELLHKKIKLHCVKNNLKIKDLLLEIIQDKEYD